MIESLVGALSAIKQATPTLLLGLALASGLLLFLPGATTDTLGLTMFRDQYRPHIGGVILLSLALLVAHGFSSAASFIKTVYSTRKARAAQLAADRRRSESLEKLTPDEKGYLLPYIVDELNTQYFGIGDGVAGGLQAKGIIYRAANVGDMVSGFAFNIQPWAREHLSFDVSRRKGSQCNLRTRSTSSWPSLQACPLTPLQGLSPACFACLRPPLMSYVDLPGNAQEVPPPAAVRMQPSSIPDAEQ